MPIGSFPNRESEAIVSSAADTWPTFCSITYFFDAGGCRFCSVTEADGLYSFMIDPPESESSIGSY